MRCERCLKRQARPGDIFCGPCAKEPMSPIRLIPTEPATEDPKDAPTAGPTRRQPSAAERMMRLLEEDYTPGISPEGDVFAIENGGPRVALLLSRYGSTLRAAALRAFRSAYGETPSANAARDALAMFEAETRFAGLEPTPLHMRFANPSPDRLLVDLGDPSARMVEVTPDGWQLRLPGPYDPLFVRTPRLGAYPEPVRGGTLDALREFVHLADEDFVLFVAWVLSAMFPTHPQPVLFLEAPHGSGKTTVGNVAVAHIDPGNWMGAKPRDDRSWETRVSRSYAVGIDNLSYLSAETQDMIARAVTGEEIARRRLFTDDDEIRFVILARFVMTSIGMPDKRGDFADRLLLLPVPPWPEDFQLIEEDVLKARILEMIPTTFGAFLDLAASVLRVLPEARATRPNVRMAAFGVLLRAVDLVLNTSGVETYIASRRDVTSSALDADQLWPQLAMIVEESGGMIEFSASEIRDRLLRRLRDDDDLGTLLKKVEGRFGELRSPDAVGAWLNRVAGSARPLGWTFEKQKSGSRAWVIASPPEREDDGNEVSEASEVSIQDALDTLDTSMHPSSPGEEGAA